jgi:hypothetical protein
LWTVVCASIRRCPEMRVRRLKLLGTRRVTSEWERESDERFERETKRKWKKLDFCDFSCLWDGQMKRLDCSNKDVEHETVNLTKILWKTRCNSKQNQSEMTNCYRKLVCYFSKVQWCVSFIYGQMKFYLFQITLSESSDKLFEN